MLGDDVVDWIIGVTCNDRSYGARPLRRALQKYIEDPLSEELIRGRLKVGGTFDVYMVDGQPHYRPTGTEAPGLQLLTV
jgi:ATP-dependent Clp protease ATP-binding subunit ClpC